MPSLDKSARRKSGSPKSDLHEARPLLQAIFIGMLLASALVAAAAMANPDPQSGTVKKTGPAQERTVPHPAAIEGFQ